MEAKENLRGSGILLSISSLPSPYGIGTLGREAYNFVDLLGDLKQKYWQVLPVGPTIFGDSPYQPSSGCAGNIYFIDLDKLVDEGLLEKEEILGYNWGTDESEIDYAALHQNRCKILQKAFERFDTNAQEFQDFVKKQSEWLEQYALFMTLKTDNLYKNWSEWSSEYRNPQTVALEKYQKKNYNTITFWKFCQYKFFEQWEDLKNYANSKGVYIIGDISFYVGYDSVDVWAERQLFMMSANDTPEYVAAAGPDKYSESGQVWGNPMYDWDAMKEDNFSWWRKRMRVCRELFDIVRIDHFAGIVKAYAVPYGQDKSLSGKWFKGPGRRLVNAINEELEGVNVVAEAAKIDGANAAQIFFKITLPYIMFIMGPYIITQFTGNINNFNVIYLLSAGKPTPVGDSAGKTDLLVTWLYKLTIDNQEYNIGAVIGILTFIVLSIVALVTYRNTKSYKDEEGFM